MRNVVFLLCLLFAIGCVVTVDPRAKDVTSLKARTTLNLSRAASEKAIRQIAVEMRARVDTSADGLLTVVMPKISAVELDRNCVYPIVDKKTGGHLHTFATWQSDLTRTTSFHFADGDVLLLLSLQEDQPGQTIVEFWGNCVADTELGRLPAESTGMFEEKFLNEVFAVAGQHLGSIPKGTHDKDAPAEESYKETRELTPGSHKQWVRTLLPGVSDRTLVRVLVAGSTESVWRAAVQANTKFSEKTGRPSIRVDDKMHTIQNGPSTKGVVAAGDERWSDEFVTSVVPDGSQTRVSVVRSLRVSSDGGGTWRGAPSDGEMENWILSEMFNSLAPVSPVKTAVPVNSVPVSSAPVSSAAPVFSAAPPVKAPVAPPKNATDGTCTVDQVLKMKEAGLSDVQIRAACSPR
jgi:hypothetical protein